MKVNRTWRLGVAGLLAAVLIGITGAPSAAPPLGPAIDETVHLNEVQVVGSHNSYHVEASNAESDLRRSVIGDEENGLQYNHAPLEEQFSDQRVRQIELDVFRDDAGGKYSTPLIRAATGGGDYDPAMDRPGTKVLHAQDVDYRSTCLSLVSCLTTVRTWSDANPTHLPIAILVELKDSPLGIAGTVTPDPWDAAALRRLDDEILSVMPRDQVITPDDVRGSRATLDEAVTTDGWPTLGASRGKVMFLLDNGGGYRTSYLAGNPTLEGRVIFTSADPGQPDAGFVKVNEAIPNVNRIQQLVSDGYVVRTRADADTAEARSGDTTTRDAALASGAQWVSTDYPVPEYARRFGTTYSVGIPGGTVARCNPINGPADCIDADIDSLGESPTDTPTPPTAPVEDPPGPEDPPIAQPAGAIPADASFTG